jgi:hypothetical protein
MYSAWNTSLIGAVVLAAAIVIAGLVQMSRSSMPDPMSLSFAMGVLVFPALVAGVLAALAVRGGLFFARCRELAGRQVVVIAVVNVVILGILGAVPVESHAVRLDVPSSQRNPFEVPATFYLIIAAMLLAPVLVAYLVARFARVNR